MNTRTTLHTLRAVAVIAAAVFGAAVPAAQADTPGPHPNYLHALSDLRDARALLSVGDEQNVEQWEGAAVIEIDQAVSDLRQAAADDGKDLRDHPPIDIHLSHRDRLARAFDLLVKARQDITRSEDNNAALRWRSDALLHIDRAGSDTNRALRTDYHDDHPRLPGSHPHFLHAISDLRAARALLKFPDEGNVMADERQAVNAITDAIRFARQGAIDDGLDVFANPPAARNLPRRSRLQQARALLTDAYEQMTHYRETDLRADTPLHRSVDAVYRAGWYADKAIADDRRDDTRFGR